ncbi:MAG: ATP-binding cassette domain-containing protein [Ignavibacteria bacterium]|jgi:ABC-2 type transport system ATP-binding protein
MIHVESLTKIFRTHKKEAGLVGSIKSLFNRQYTEFIAADAVTFSIPEGALVGMLGANGAGKTTTLKMLSGLLYPTSGTATVMGFVPWQRDNEFRRNFSLVMGQRNQLWWDLPAADTFLLNKEMYRISDTDYKKRLNIMSEHLGIADKLHVQVRKLSLGERMKCELIGALLHYPKVVFLDEPTIGLDIVAQHALREFIAEFNKEHGTTIILTSHYMDDIEALCERVILMDEGSIQFDGGLSVLVDRFSHEKVVTIFLDEMPDAETLKDMEHIAEIGEDRIIFKVPKHEIADITTKCLGKFSVRDITISDMPVEEVIREIFSGKTVGIPEA